MKPPRHFLVAFLLFTSFQSHAQQTYHGTIVTKLGKEQKGTITVNLDGSNNELIPISYTEKTKSKSKGTKMKMESTTTLSLNVALIHHIIINDTTYYFRDVKYGYDEKKRMNVAVRLISGTLNCGLFQEGRSNDPALLAAKLPKADFSQLVSTEFEYYKELSGWHAMAFSDCKSLQEKMMNNQPGYVWEKGNDKTFQVAVWNKWIKEYNECKPAKS